jgi:hypothetical protein
MMDKPATFARSDQTLSTQDPSRAALVRLMTAAACCLLLGCAGKTPPPEAQNRCPPNRPGCQVEVVFTNVGLGERVAYLSARLSAEQPSISYMFTAAANETLRLKWAGPAARLVLTRPDGQVSGPGLPVEMVLFAKGKYVLRVAANSTADESYGEFQLELRLVGTP